MPAAPPIAPEPPARARRGRGALPWGALGMAALIVLVEGAIQRHHVDLSTVMTLNWRLDRHAPARHARGAEVLCFGDSMVKFGVQPRVLGAALGRSVRNFALYCGPPQTSYFQLRRAFDAGARPAAVLVDFQPEILVCEPLKVTSKAFAEILDFRELLDLCWTARDADRLAEFGVARLLASSRQRFEIRAAVLAAATGQPTPLGRDRLDGARRNWQLNRGGEALPKNPNYRGDVPDTDAYPVMFWTPWRPNPLNVAYLERFLDLASRRGVPVFWLLQPNVNEVDVRRERVGYNAQYEQFVRQYLDRYANLHVVDGRRVNYPASFFNDPVHLDRDGGTAYSLGIADVLRPFLAGTAAPRWQPLPDRRDGAAGVPLEDTLQSVLAVRAAQSEAATARR